MAAAAAERPSSLAAPPPPRPLPAGRFANRPNRQKLRARGPLGAFLLWCELPMVVTGASTGNLAQLNQPGRRARSPGRQAERRARAATAGAPSPSSATPPGSVANGRTRGGAGGGVGPGPPHRLRLQDLGDQLSHPAQKALGKVWSVQVRQAGSWLSQLRGRHSEDCSGTEINRNRALDRRGLEPSCC